MATPAWNDTFGEGLNWQESAFLAMFEQAIWERQQANLTPAKHDPPPAIPTFSQSDTLPGEVVQGIVRHWQDTVAHVNAPANGLCAKYFLPGLDVSETLPSDWIGKYALASLVWSPAALLTAVNGHEGWTRKYEQRFATMVSTTYTDGRSFTDGDRARCQADWKVYIRSSGAWVVDSATSGDTVTAYGDMQAGDYIGHWCFTELRDALNLMTVTRAYCDLYLDDAVNSGAVSDAGDNSSASVARTSADGNWTGTASPTYVDPPPIVAKKTTSWMRPHPWDDPEWYAAISRWTSKVLTLIYPMVSVSCDHWLYFSAAETGTVYDDQGDHSAPEDIYWKWLTRTPTSTNDLTDQFSDVTADPPHWGTAPAVDDGSGDSVTVGYKAIAPITIANWQFTQGPA